MSEWLTVTEAADMAGMSVRTIERYVARGHVRSQLSQDGRRLIWRGSLDQLGRKQRGNAHNGRRHAYVGQYSPNDGDSDGRQVSTRATDTTVTVVLAAVAERLRAMEQEHGMIIAELRQTGEQLRSLREELAAERRHRAMQEELSAVWNRLPWWHRLWRRPRY